MTGESRQCEGTTKSGRRCRRRARLDSPYCTDDHDPGLDDLDTPLADLPTGSLEERLAWLEKVRRGDVTEEKVNPKGGTVDIPTSVRDRILAAKAAEDLQRELDDRAKNWVTREQFEAGLSSIALIVRDRLRAIPARMFGQDLERVQEMELEIDAALEEAADELARVMRRVLGDTE